MVDVSSQSNKVNITVSSSGVSSNVNASGDTSHYYSEKAREWAISNRIVDGVDYSSKYYAGRANQSALNAQSFAQSAQDSYNNFQQSVDGALSNIDSSVQEAIGEINNTKTDIITDLEFVADGEKKEIEDLIDSGKDELKEAIGDVKVLTTLEIGDIGFTQMAIDESKGKRRILNGQLVIQDQYVQFTNIIKQSISLNPSLACTEAEWQTEVTMNTFGLCGKFVIDDEGGTIRLPKYPNYFIAGLANIATVAGNGMTLGLTNGTQLGSLATGANSVLYPKQNMYGTDVGHSWIDDTPFTVGRSIGVTTDSTKSGIEAQINEKQIAGQYFIQVATGSETEDNIINEIELNNPFSLLDYKYSEYELNNISWLRSNGQYNSKAVYPAVYDLLLKIYNGTETKAGVSVKLSTEEFTDYDFVLNTTEETFRLPVKVKLASGKAVVGNGISLGLTDGTTNQGFVNMANGWGYIGLTSAYGVGTGTVVSNSVAPQNYNAIGVTTDPTKSGLELSDSDLYLYFYVGETVQNANLINAGRIEEKFASLIPNNSSLISGYGMPSNRYIDLTLGASGSTYTAPANGYAVVCKQTSGGSQNINIKVNNVMMDICWGGASLLNLVASCQVQKGKPFSVEYTTGGATQFFIFIYAEGEK